MIAAASDSNVTGVGEGSQAMKKVTEEKEGEEMVEGQGKGGGGRSLSPQSIGRV